MDVKLTKEPRNKSRIGKTVWAVGDNQMTGAA